MMNIYKLRLRHGLNPQRGMTLLEVLIALLVLSIGLLGMAGLQATSIRSSQSAYMRSQASILAYDAIDRMRANQAAAISAANPYNLALATTPGAPPSNCNTSTCTTAQLTAFDLFEWTQTLASELTGGDGSISRAVVSGRTIFSVIVQWDDTRGVGALTSLQVETEL